MARKNIRQQVLDAAIDLVASTGSAQFTLDAIAAHAGVSKGGLQHHFRAKASLVEAMVERVVETFDEALKRETGDEAATINGTNPLGVYLKRSFSGLGSKLPTAQVIFAVQAYDPKLLGPLHRYFRQRTRDLGVRYQDQLGQVLALMLVADGLWMFDAIGSSPFAPGERTMALEAALKWAEGVTPVTPVGPRPRRKGRAPS